MPIAYPRLVVLILLIMLPLIGWSQFIVSGTVKDNRKKPIAAATVIVRNSALSTTTDSTGAFSLSLSGQSAILEISAAGFIKQDVNVSATVSTVYVQLKKSPGKSNPASKNSVSNSEVRGIHPWAITAFPAK
jgi:hypothetical protein